MVTFVVNSKLDYCNSLYQEKNPSCLTVDANAISRLCESLLILFQALAACRCSLFYS